MSETTTVSGTPGELDIHLIHEGRHEELWKVLGAQVVDAGVDFRVWAPNALEVQVLGEWTGWDGSRHPMSRVGDSGIWSAHVPGIGLADNLEHASVPRKDGIKKALRELALHEP